MMKRAIPKSWGALAKKLGGSKNKVEAPEPIKRADDVHISIYKVADSKKKDKEILSNGEGCWLSHLILDGECVWKIEDEIQPWKERSPSDFILPSDMMHRSDIPFMIEKKWEEAEHAKVEMEELQRKDKKLRDEAEARRKKMGSKK